MVYHGNFFTWVAVSAL